MTPHYKCTVKVWVDGPCARQNITLSITTKGWSIDEAFKLLKQKTKISNITLVDAKKIFSVNEVEELHL